MSNICYYAASQSLLKLLQEACDTNLVLDDAAKLVYAYTLLLHSVAETQGYGVVLQCVIIHSYAIRSTYSVLTTITLADSILLIIVSVEVELEIVYNLASLLWQSVLLYKWQHSELGRSECRWQKKYNTCLTILELLLTIRVTHNREEHTVDTDRSLDYIRSVRLLGLWIEVLD